MQDTNDIAVAMYQLFDRDPLGSKVFDFLVARFYDSSLFNESATVTAYAVGQRDVIKYIIDRMKYAQLPKDNNDDIQKEE